MNKLSKIVSALPLLVAAAAVSAGTENAEGQQVYEKNCARCHDTGRMGAPMLEELSDWTDPSALVWSDVHLQHLDDGFLRSADDDAKKGISAGQMEAATNYIVSILGKK
jgi:cytochrome c5